MRWDLALRQSVQEGPAESLRLAKGMPLPAPPTSAAGPPLPRRIFHILAGSTIPLAGIFAPRPELAVALAVLAVGSLALDLTRFRVSRLNRLFLRGLRPLLKSSESGRVTGATWLLLAAALAFPVFDREVAVAAFFYLSLGDPAAALVGRPMPGPRLFGKSPAGTLAFITVSLLAAAVLVGAGFMPWHWAFAVGAIVAGLVELLPLPGDDNLWVPLAAGAAMQLLVRGIG